MNADVIIKELSFKAVRSSGAGGQHVNKTASKVEVTFSVLTSEGLSEIEKQRLQSKLGQQISSEGLLIIQCSETRSQHRNKAIGITRLLTVLTESLKVAKPRKKSRPSQGAIEKRIRAKKNNALKKANRKPPQHD